MRIINISEDQNSITLEDGSEYVSAEPKETVYCFGCFFIENDIGCPYDTPEESYCEPPSRKDGKFIVWKKKEY